MVAEAIDTVELPRVPQPTTILRSLNPLLQFERPDVVFQAKNTRISAAGRRIAARFFEESSAEAESNPELLRENIQRVREQLKTQIAERKKVLRSQLQESVIARWQLEGRATKGHMREVQAEVRELLAETVSSDEKLRQFGAGRKILTSVSHKAKRLEGEQPHLFGAKKSGPMDEGGGLFSSSSMDDTVEFPMSSDEEADTQRIRVAPTLIEEFPTQKIRGVEARTLRIRQEAQQRAEKAGWKGTVSRLVSRPVFRGLVAAALMGAVAFGGVSQLTSDQSSRVHPARTFDFTPALEEPKVQELGQENEEATHVPNISVQEVTEPQVEPTEESQE